MLLSVIYFHIRIQIQFKLKKFRDPCQKGIIEGDQVPVNIELLTGAVPVNYLLQNKIYIVI